MCDEKPTYCIALRLRRTTREDAYINVPLTDVIMKQNEDGAWGIDTDAFVAEAIRLSGNPQVQWQTETCEVEPHPIQCPRPEGRAAYDVHYDHESEKPT
jgi:hypothetical protein